MAGLSHGVTPVMEKPVKDSSAGVKMYFKIKKVKGKPYLYRCWWDTSIHDVVCRSVGNCYWLEELAKQWRKAKKRKRLQLKKKKKKKQRGPSSSLVRTPPSHGGKQYSSVLKFYPSHIELTDQELLDKFHSWLLNQVSEDTAKYYVNTIKRIGKWVANYELKEKQRKAYRKLVNFLYDTGLIDYNTKLALLDHYKLMETREHRTSKWISDEQVTSILNSVDREPYKTLLVLRLVSGARLSHIVYMLKHWNPGEIVQHLNKKYEPRLYCNESFCRYYLGIKEAGKRCDYIYFPREMLDKISELLPFTKKYRQVKDWFSKHKISHKKLRNYVEQRLRQLAIDHKIPQDAVNLIMSRELSVSGTHYDDTRKRADKLYTTYIIYLKKHKII